MPCLIITGHPSSGKTTIANKLKEQALRHPLIDDVIIVNEETACPDYTKNQCYESAAAEKRTRGALKSQFDRTNKAPKTLVILDSLNYIKGLRYELHVISKAVGERHGILWVLNRVNVVEEWNNQRPVDEQYRPQLLKELIQRYEPPDQRNRWDKPLYTIDVAPPQSQQQNSSRENNDDSKTAALSQSVYNMHDLSDAIGESKSTTAAAGGSVECHAATKPKPKKKSAFSRAKAKPKKEPCPAVPPQQQQQVETPIANTNQVEGESKPLQPKKTVEETLDEILDQFLRNVQPLKAGAATQLHVATDANVLQELDATTTKLIAAISNAQTVHTGGKLQISTTGGETLHMECQRVVALPELRRLRKQFMTWVGTHPPEDSSEKGISEWFLRYIEDQL